jgi:hypothetical protein
MINGSVKLFHVSEDPAIARFDPREPTNTDAGVTGPCVWAVDETRLRNYLLPRDCPRVTYYAHERSEDSEVRALIGSTTACAVIAIESAWLDRVRATTLYLYELPAEGFELIDTSAGYWINRSGVVPIGVKRIDDCLRAIAEQRAQIRILPSL